ncbi:MAG: carboxymuconolactone decarboxylase family protein [Sphingomonas sp.]
MTRTTPRIATPATVADAPLASQPLLDAVAKQLGTVPNMFRAIAVSPQALEGYLGVSGALGKGALPAATRERIALAVAEVNGCSYCLSAHTYLGRTLARLDDAEMTANRNGASNDVKADAAVRFAAKVATDRGHITDSDFAAVKLAGYTDAQVIEIVQHVALNSWTNFFNEVFQTEIDFPVVKARPQDVRAA